MFADPANIFVFVVLFGFVAFVFMLKMNSDKVAREEKMQKEEKEREGKKA
jgi:hypothetical protein